MTASTPPSRDEKRSSLLALALLSAISLALPAGIYLLAVIGTSNNPRATGNVMAVVIAAAIAIAYAALVLAARGAGAPMVAGVSTTLGVFGVVLLIPIFLLAEVERMSGGHSMGTVAAGALLYVAGQFAIAAGARALAGAGQQVRASGGFSLGVALPLVCAVLLWPMAGASARRDTDRAIANVQAREKTRGDLFALYACATAHRALAPRHNYPASLAALGENGDKCLPAAIASGSRGFNFEYTPRMSGGDTVAGFTVRAIPKLPDPNATMLTMDERAIITENYVNTRYASLPLRTPPGLDMLVAMRDCERLYRHYRHIPPSDLRTLRSFADSTLRVGTPEGCWSFRSVN